MKIKFCGAVLLVGALALSSVGQAKTFKYELDDFHTYPGQVNYPGLDLNGQGSAELTVERDSENSPAEITSLEINFANAPSISIRNFKSANGQYRAEVSDVWVYRKLIVEISFYGPEFDAYGNRDVYINAVVAENDLFISSPNNSYNYPNYGVSLFAGHGLLNDVSSLLVVDNETINVDGDNVTLNLKNGFRPEENTNEPTFVIDVVWMGHGQNTLYIPSGLPKNFVSFAEPIRLVLDQVPGPNGPEYMVSVVVKDAYGGEMQGAPFPLKDVLHQAYNLPL